MQVAWESIPWLFPSPVVSLIVNLVNGVDRGLLRLRAAGRDVASLVAVEASNSALLLLLAAFGGVPSLLKSVAAGVERTLGLILTGRVGRAAHIGLRAMLRELAEAAEARSGLETAGHHLFLLVGCRCICGLFGDFLEGGFLGGCNVSAEVGVSDPSDKSAKDEVFIRVDA